MEKLLQSLVCLACMLDTVGMLWHIFLKMLTPLFDMMYFLSHFDNKKTKQLPDWKGLIKNIILNKMKIQYFVHVHLNCLNLMTIHNPFLTHLKHHHYLILKVEIDTLHNKYNITADIRISKPILLNCVRKKESLKSLSLKFITCLTHFFKFIISSKCSW